MSRKLTPGSSLDNLKKEAKRWLDALQSDVALARQRLERAFPDAPKLPTLRDVQHALALEHGLPGWTALRDALAGRRPAAASPEDERVTSFLRNASLDWRVGGSMRTSARRTAERLLERHPGIGRDSIFTAVVSGDLAEVERRLAEQPALAAQAGGPRNWPPLLYLCSTRLEVPAASDHAVAIARALIDRGADPDAFYPGGNKLIHYTALCCAAGEGEEDAPPHPRREELWKLLLERGAEPYDMQTLYNTHFHADMVWFLELMYARSIALGRQADWADPDWNMLGMGGFGQGAYYLLTQAIRKNDLSFAEWLLAHGASPNPGPSTNPKAPKVALVEAALLRGHNAIAELLIRHGAPRVTPVLESVQAFAAACFRKDAAEAQRLLAEQPEYRRDTLAMFEAARQNRVDVVEFVIGLGFSIDIEDKNGARALHEAAYHNAVDVAGLLLARGAAVDPRERVHGNTPLGHAVYGKNERMIELLAPVSRDLWELVWTGALERVRELLAEDPSRALTVGRDGDTPLMWLPDHDFHAFEIARLFVSLGADTSRTNRQGETAAAIARRRGMDEIADMLEAPGPQSGIAVFEQLAADLAAAHATGDADALKRLSGHFGHHVTVDEVREHVRRRGGGGEFGVPEARWLVARLYGFGAWDALVANVSHPPRDGRPPAPGMMSSVPPFYRIDARDNSLEPRPPLNDADWDTILGIMKEQGVTKLNAGGHMTDAAMAKVARAGFITRLDVGGSDRLTDDGLEQLRHMPQLEQLHMGGWHSTITDRGLEVLRHLPALRRFHMGWTRTVSDAGVAWLSYCELLEDVNFIGSTVGDGAINALTGKKHLHKFSTGRLVTDAGLPLLHQFPVFKSWQGGEPRYDLMSFNAEPNSLMLDGPFTDAGMAKLAGLDGLFGLNLFWHAKAMTPAGLAPLKDLANLGFLGAHGELATDAAMPFIAAIPRLRMLMAQGTTATDDGFESLSQSQTLEYFWGRECPNLHGRGFRALSRMPALKGIAASCRFVDDASLASFPDFPALTWLMPMDVPDEGFRHVGRCAKLEKLTCMYCRDTGDVATGHIGGLQLREYYAGSSLITDRSLEILSRMTSLEKVELENVKVTDAGIAALGKLPRLREFSVEMSPGVSREGMSVFPATVRVSYRP